MKNLSNYWLFTSIFLLLFTGFPQTKIMGADYKVLTNKEGRYLIWSKQYPNPKGWRDAGKKGTLRACHQYIEEVWTDMRPLSLRKHLLKTRKSNHMNHNGLFLKTSLQLDNPFQCFYYMVGLKQ